MIQIGGYEFVTKQDTLLKDTALHWACRFNTPIEVIEKLREVGGKELVHMGGYVYHSALDWECDSEAPNVQVIGRLLEVCGEDIVFWNGIDEWRPLHFASVTMHRFK